MKFDVVIVGASSAGLYAAELLARQGVRVCVIERNKDLQPTRRTLIVTPELQKVLGSIPSTVQLHQTNFMEITTANHSITVPLREPDLIIERSELASWLRYRAEAAGVTLLLGYKFKNLESHGRGLQLVFAGEQSGVKIVATRAMIGADGLLSDIARTAGIPHPLTCPIVQAEVELPRSWNPEVTKVWFEPEESKYFYWLIPESEERGVVGLVGDGRIHILSKLQRFLEELDVQVGAYQGARVALHHPRLRPWTFVEGTPVYLIGDAAGQVKVTTVGGTVTGLIGARAAVSSILNGSSYRKELRSLKRELDLQWAIRLLLNQLDNGGYEDLISALNPHVRDFLSKNNRDRMAPVFWQLFIQPRLLRIGASALVSWMLRRNQSSGKRRTLPIRRKRSSQSGD